MFNCLLDWIDIPLVKEDHKHLLALTKQGPPRQSLEELVTQNIFRHALTNDNLVVHTDGEIKISNLVTKAKVKEMDQDV